MALPRRQPNLLCYNDLTGDEVKHILGERFTALIESVPYFQRHITLPRVKMTLSVKLEMCADQAAPEVQALADIVEIRSDNAPEANVEEELTAVVDASPRGDPPDKVREDHDLPVPTPTRGSAGYIQDHLAGKVVEEIPGVRIDRRGHDTVITQDLGPAHLGQGGERIAPGVGGNYNKAGSDGRPLPPMIKPARR